MMKKPPHPKQTISVDAAPDAYTDMIADLQKVRRQVLSIARGEAQHGCALCHDSGHTAEACAMFNPLLLAQLGNSALIGELYKCFHCGAVFCDEISARGHFGSDIDEIARCLRDRADDSDPSPGEIMIAKYDEWLEFTRWRASKPPYHPITPSPETEATSHAHQQDQAD